MASLAEAETATDEFISGQTLSQVGGRSAPGLEPQTPQADFSQQARILENDGLTCH